MAAPSHPPAIAPTPAPTAAPAPAPIAVFLPGVAHPPRTTTADMTNRKLRIRISSAASVTHRPHPRTGFASSMPGEEEPLRRSEEHTSELQSHLNLVCRLLLE